MSIISNISVGDISYFFVDQPPTHFAVKGCISIFDNFLYINNDGANTWIKILSPDHGSLNISGYSTAVDFDGQTIGSWYPWNSVATYTLGNSVNFSRQVDPTFGDFLRYDGITTIRVLVRQTSTNRGGTGKWMSWLIGPAKNFTIPDKYNEFFVQDNSATQNVASLRVLELSPGDSVIASISPVSRESGGPANQRAYLTKHSSLELIKIDESFSTNFFLEDWETGSFVTNNWNVVNPPDPNEPPLGIFNQWVVGAATASTGFGSAYISTDNKIKNYEYDNTLTTIAHFYKDFEISATASSIILEFDWMASGENTAGNAVQYDYGAVVITDTTVTPVAGTEVSTVEATGTGNGRLAQDFAANDGKFNLGYGTNPGTTWNTERINISAYSGLTKRLVFTWVNDASVGTDPPFSLDNIKIIETVW